MKLDSRPTGNLGMAKTTLRSIRARFTADLTVNSTPRFLRNRVVALIGSRAEWGRSAEHCSARIRPTDGAMLRAPVIAPG
jgi:hypothetical protein